jgi:hypothetical protein
MSVAAITVLAGSVHSVYERNIIETGREAEFLFFVSFLVTFSFIRTSAHLIKAQVKWWPGNVEVGGTHIHHLVWGICLLLIFGWLGITQELGSPWLQIVAVVFGIGAGLTLDEFALWLTLRDVYWEQEGRRSIDAVIIVGAVTAALLVGLRGWLEAATDVENVIFNVLGISWIATIISVTICVTKGRYGLALVGILINPFSIFGACRLARPTSFWAKKRYDPEKMEKARKRFANGRGPLERIDRRLHAGHEANEAPDARGPGAAAPDDGAAA